jgi:hypothetical protein
MKFRPWEGKNKKRPRFLLSLDFSPFPYPFPPLQLSIGKASTCQTERRKSEREGGGGGSNFNDNKKRGILYYLCSMLSSEEPLVWFKGRHSSPSAQTWAPANCRNTNIRQKIQQKYWVSYLRIFSVTYF